MRFTLRELSGSLGDLGLFIPLVVAACIAGELNLGVVLIAAGAMNIATGFLFNQPIPVQPMKAIAAIIIAEGLTQSQIAAAGLAMGCVLLLLAHSGLIHKITERIPLVLVRGIQLGVGCKLILLAIDWASALPVLSLNGFNDAVNSLLVSFLLLCLLIFTIHSRFPTLLIVFTAGCAVLMAQISSEALSNQRVALDVSDIRLLYPSMNDFLHASWHAVLPQLPLTLLNSVIAICALSADYFPKKGIATKKMASSVAWMNIVCAPFGALPMCHGASGLAVQYQFGARTGGSVIMLGLLKILIGLAFGGILALVLVDYPKAILAPLLIIAGLALFKSTWNERASLNLVVLGITAVGIIFFSTLIGFIAGCFAYWFASKRYSF